MDRLLLRHNTGRVITVDGNTQIGRGHGQREDPTTWYTDRPRPPDFAELALVIAVEGSPSMSRNHAGIRRERERYTVQDLNSLNGTWKNGVRMEPGIRYPMLAGDRIAMGRDVFEVGETPEAFAAVNTPSATAALRAVVQPEWYLGVAGCDEREHARRTFYTSMARIARALHGRGYHTEVHGIRSADVPRYNSRVIGVVHPAAILEALGRRADVAGPRSHTFFHYSGHGTPDGLLAGSGELLTPRTLFDAVGAIRGKKFLLLDACHAGVCLGDRERIPPQTAILAATRTADSEAYADGRRAMEERTDWPMTNLARRLWELLRERTGAFDILSERAALEAAFHEEDDGFVHVQEPRMNTVPYTLCVRSVA